MDVNGFDLIERKYDTIAVDPDTRDHIGSYDRTAGAVVARSFHEWILALEAL